MADNRCFVQFPHPGGEHKPDGHGKIGWNKTHQGNRENPHKRKFMQFHGKWVDRDGSTHNGDLRAWGEWEPESELISKFGREKNKPHHPRYLWKPYWVQRGAYRCLHNTDPFIFGDSFLYSNCGQLAQSKEGLKHLSRGSVIAFGSGKKIDGQRRWVLDTVLVVRDSVLYDPLKPCEALKCKVPDEFLKVTGGPLAACAEEPGKGSASTACAPASRQLRLYRGATPDHPVDEMFSFFPAIPADGKSTFARPVVSLDEKYFTSGNWQAPKGARHCRKPEELRSLWDSLVAQVRAAGLILGTRAKMPETRKE